MIWYCDGIYAVTSERRTMMLHEEIDTTGLTRVNGFDFPIYVSGTDVARAQRMAQRAARTVSWLSEMVRMPPVPPLFVLSAVDWHRIALVNEYGLPHVNRTRIVLGKKVSRLWKTLIPRVWDQLGAEERLRLCEVYGSPPDLSPFADLLISHELTHLADRPGHLDSPDDKSQRWGIVPRVLWFVELFANVGLHGYISECEPDEMQRLTTLFEVVGETPASAWPISALSEMYDTIASSRADGANYCWYEFRLQAIAGSLWATGGAAALKKMHAALHGPVLSDKAIIDFIETIDGRAAGDVRRWLLEASG
jgi:hypothetical protein